MMTPLVRLTALGFAIQLSGMLGFMGISKTSLDVPGKQIIIVLLVIAIIGLLTVAVKQLSVRELVLLATALAVAFACVYHVLGLILFPGLLTKMELLSLQHLEGVATQIMFVFVGYAGGIFVIWSIRRLLKD